MAEYSKSQPTAVAASGPKSTGKTLPKGAYCSGVEITPSENGGYTVTHRYAAPATKGDPYPYLPSKDYTFESMDSMLGHLKTAFD